MLGLSLLVFELDAFIENLREQAPLPSSAKIPQRRGPDPNPSTKSVYSAHFHAPSLMQQVCSCNYPGIVLRIWPPLCN